MTAAQPEIGIGMFWELAEDMHPAKKHSVSRDIEDRAGRASFLRRAARYAPRLTARIIASRMQQERRHATS